MSIIRVPFEPWWCALGRPFRPGQPRIAWRTSASSAAPRPAIGGDRSAWSRGSASSRGVRTGRGHDRRAPRRPRAQGSPRAHPTSDTPAILVLSPSLYLRRRSAASFAAEGWTTLETGTVQDALVTYRLAHPRVVVRDGSSALDHGLGAARAPRCRVSGRAAGVESGGGSGFPSARGLGSATMAVALTVAHLALIAVQTTHDGCCEGCGTPPLAERPPQVPAEFCSAACYHEQRRLRGEAAGAVRMRAASAPAWSAALLDA